MSAVTQLADRLRSAASAVAFTGAGMSTESGISDFRSPGGIWSRFQPVYYDDFLNSREARVRYWEARRAMHDEFAGAKPNDGHRALAKLEATGRLVALITQNIDGLHQDGGSDRVIELHGTNRVMACVVCGKEWQPHEIMARIDAGEDAPDCDACDGPIKPKTISFGQAMPQAKMEEATQLSLNSDVFLAIGSSLVVEPAASLPRIAKESGAYLTIINKTETPLDPIADLIIREPIGKTLSAVLSLLPQPTE